MSINLSKDTPDRRFENMVADLKRQIEELRTNQLSTLVVSVVTADPASPVNGQCWYNSTSHELKVYKNGSTRTITTS
jgi:hypothetical protein